MKERIRDAVEIIIGIAILCIILHVTGIGCPIRYVTGIPCPTCGMTRAWVELLRLNVRGAFSYHPLFWTIPILGIAFVIKPRMPKRIFEFVMIIIGVAFFVVYLTRICR